MRRALLLLCSAALASCFNLQKALDDCRDDGGNWVCPRVSPDGGSGGGSGGSGGTGGSGGSGGTGGSGGSGGAGGGSVVLGDGGCPGAQHPVLPPVSGFGPWCWHNPLPTGQELRDVVGTSENNVVVVGTGDTVLRWNGSAWRQDEYPPTLSVREVNAAELDALGDLYIGGNGIGGLMRRPADGGAWAVVDSTADEIYQIAARPDGGVFAAGGNGVWTSDPPQKVLNNTGRIHYGVLTTGPGPTDFLTSVSRAAPDGGPDQRCIVRGDGVPDFCESRLDDAGTGIDFSFTQLWADSAGRRHVAANGTWIPPSTWAGAVYRQVPGLDWVRVQLGQDSTSDLRSGTGVGNNASFAVGQDCKAALVVADGGGPAVTQLPFCTYGNLRGTWYAADAGKAWVVGELGIMLRGDPLDPSNATKWGRLDTGPRTDFYGLVAWNGGLWALGEDTAFFSVLDRRRAFDTGGQTNWMGGWVASDGSLVLVSQQSTIARLFPDGGFKTWAVTNPVGGGSLNLHDVWGSNDEDVLITASQGLFAWKLDAGTQVRALGVNEFLYKVSGDPATGEAFTVGNNSTIFRRATRDAGWGNQRDGGGALFAVTWVNPSEAFAVGDNLAYRWDGTDWSDISPPSAALTSVVVTQGRVYAVGTNGQGFYRSSSAIGSWSPLGIPTPINFERILPYGGKLFIAGYNGFVLSMPEPP
jgi:hypothetical protein